MVAGGEDDARAVAVQGELRRRDAGPGVGAGAARGRVRAQHLRAAVPARPGAGRLPGGVEVVHLRRRRLAEVLQGAAQPGVPLQDAGVDLQRGLLQQIGVREGEPCA